MSFPELPFERLETVFLDVGNTLISMDYEWISEEMTARGVDAGVARVRRAEAAARPVVSRAVAGQVSTEGLSMFSLYLKAILENLGVDGGIGALVDELTPVFRGPGRERLWTFVLPGVPEALSSMKALGLRLVVVSNSDGTVENVLIRGGLREYLDAVFDSHLVGFEKPDPRFFRHALEATGSSPETTLHVGDLYSADVEGGRAAGVHTALLDPFGDFQDADCPRFSDLATLADSIESARRQS